MDNTLKELLMTTTKLMETVTEALRQEQEVKPEPIQMDKLSGKITITPKELAEVMGCGIGQAYNMVNIQGFPVIKVGTRYKIPVQEFRQWLQSSAGLEVLQ